MGFVTAGRRIATAVLAASLCALAAATAAEAQARQAAPAPSQEQMQQQMDMMGPAMAKMTEKEEATQIVKGTGMPTMPTSR